MYPVAKYYNFLGLLLHSFDLVAKKPQTLLQKVAKPCCKKMSHLVACSTVTPTKVANPVAKSVNFCDLVANFPKICIPCCTKSWRSSNLVARSNHATRPLLQRPCCTNIVAILEPSC